MGNVRSYFWSPKSSEFKADPSLDIADSATGLTARQKLVIRENWGAVQKNLQQNGVELFIALFKAYPPYQKLFKSFADVPIEELHSNKKLYAHATNVMYALAALVDNMDDPECLKELLVKTGENHGKRKVIIEQFENLKEVFLTLLQEKLGDNFTPFASKAWQEMLRVMNSNIEQGMKNLVN